MCYRTLRLLDSILIQSSRLHNIKAYLTAIHTNIILPSTLLSCEWYLTLSSLNQKSFFTRTHVIAHIVICTRTQSTHRTSWTSGYIFAGYSGGPWFGFRSGDQQISDGCGCPRSFRQILGCYHETGHVRFLSNLSLSLYSSVMFYTI